MIFYVFNTAINKEIRSKMLVKFSIEPPFVMNRVFTGLSVDNIKIFPMSSVIAILLNVVSDLKGNFEYLNNKF